MPMPPPPPPPPPSTAEQDGEAGGVAGQVFRWYRRRPRVLQWVMGAGVVVVALSVVGALIGGDEEDDTAPVTTTTVDMPCDPAYKSPPCVPHRDGGDVDCSDIGYRVYLHDPSDDPHHLDSGLFTGDGRGCRDQPEHPSNTTTTTTPPTTTNTTTTTTPPTTTNTTTTTAPTTTTTGTGTSDSELTASEKACADNWDTISHAEMLRMKRDRSIDGIHDWSGGYWVSYEKIMDSCLDLTRAAPTTTTTTVAESVGERNARETAADYLEYSAFSRNGLIGQLEFEGFTPAQAEYGVDAVDTDWNEQAALSAADYLEYSAFSRNGLIGQLEFEGFTPAQAEYGVDAVDADWNEQAALSAADYLEYSAFSRNGLIGQLEFEGFTPAQAEYGVDAVGY